MTEPLPFSLPAPKRRRAAKRHESPDAGTNPVARVMVDSPLPHLDRVFEYRVPADLDGLAVPGVRVRVRFAGRLADGYLIGRVAESEHVGRLAPLLRVSGPPVLAPAIVELVRAVADRYAGTFADVVRSAVPPRVAKAEAASRADAGAGAPADSLAHSSFTFARESSGAPQTDWGGDWQHLCQTLGAGVSVRAAGVLPAAVDQVAAIRDLVLASLAARRAAVVVVPDARDVRRVSAGLRAALRAAGAERSDGVQELTGDMERGERYAGFLRILRGAAVVTVGTRSAAFAPVPESALCLIWDDGSDLHEDQHAPGWHAREVFALRALRSQCSFVALSRSRSVEVQRMIETGWVREVRFPAELVRDWSPRVEAISEANLAEDEAARSARLPHAAWTLARDALKSGPVLVQVARRGYVPVTACAGCRAPAHCPDCGGNLTLTSGHAIAACDRCGRLAGDFRCPACGSRRLRAVMIGAGRTAEELGRAFPGVNVVLSDSDHGVVDSVPARPALVVATQGAEPVAVGGYGAALLLDGATALHRRELRAGEEALRRWLNAISLVRAGPRPGRVIVTHDSADAVVQALIRHDPAGWAFRELSEREASRMPPAVRVAVVRGSPAAVTDVAAELSPSGFRVLGPVAVRAGGDDAAAAAVQLIATAEVADGARLASCVKAVLARRSAAKAPGMLEIRMDPVYLG